MRDDLDLIEERDEARQLVVDLMAEWDMETPKGDPYKRAMEALNRWASEGWRPGK